MRKIILAAILSGLCQTATFGQKKYEMVIEKTDGTETVIKTEDIVRTYFREIENEGGNTGNPDTSTKTLYAIDLGLPSGTKWANVNIGVTETNNIGGYYSWGETSEKETYYWKDYQHGNSKNNIMDIGNNIAGTNYDVAHVILGGDWTMPTSEDIKELLTCCSYKWTTQNGQKGGLFTSKINGNSIFLPAGGVWWDDKLHENGKSGNYWTATVVTNSQSNAITLYFDEDGADIDDPAPRPDGNNVRPVCK